MARKIRRTNRKNSKRLNSKRLNSKRRNTKRRNTKRRNTKRMNNYRNSRVKYGGVILQARMLGDFTRNSKTINDLGYGPLIILENPVNIYMHDGTPTGTIQAYRVIGRNSYYIDKIGVCQLVDEYNSSSTGMIGYLPILGRTFKGKHRNIGSPGFGLMRNDGNIETHLPNETELEIIDSINIINIKNFPTVKVRVNGKEGYVYVSNIPGI
jgi:hypothetical protein